MEDQESKGRDVKPPRVGSSWIPGKIWPQSCEIRPGVFVTTDLSLADGPTYWRRGRPKKSGEAERGVGV